MPFGKALIELKAAHSFRSFCGICKIIPFEMANNEEVIVYIQFSSVQSLICVWLFAITWAAAHQASLSITNSRSFPSFLLLLLLLLSRFSRVRLCATPQTAAHQAPPSLGFSRQEHRSGLSFPSPMHESEKSKWSRSVGRLGDPKWRKQTASGEFFLFCFFLLYTK